ncbi:MAG: hypothetical protein EP330_22525 [Deltaproteobacteria bacterium]|nr:MAG: hypothetical protein EP330_22525 [Deltaproteobacteria bacterium]
MSSGHGHSRTDPLRKLAIVVLLVAGVTWLYRFGEIKQSGFDHTGMLALGFVILGAHAVGELVEVIKLPHITGYLIAGMLLGPSFAEMLPIGMREGPLEHGFLNDEVIPQLALLDTLALALIALTAGGELKVEELRKGLRQILGVLGGQVITLLVGVTAFIWVVSGGVEALALPGVPAMETSQILALGACVAAIAIATSPAATIAVINGAGAKGPMTRLVLSSVVLKDVIVVVMFSVFSAVAGNMLGTSVIEGTLGSYLAVHVGGSLVVGAVVGAGLAAYLAYVNAEVLIFLVGLIYTASYISTSVHLDPVLIFIAAGFTASNFSREGDSLIHVVERLALPTYVVFFTLAGAKLHLDHVLEVAPYAVAMVLVRVGMIFVGVRAGATLTGADDNMRRYGWMGFASQAGVALALSGLLGQLHPEMGPKLETLVIAGIAINELIGPVLLSMGLSISGEASTGDEDHVEELPDELTEDKTLAVWTPPEGRRDPWGPPLEIASVDLLRAAREIEAELQSIVRDVERGPLEDFRRSASEHLRALRREFLRHQRRAHSLVEHEENPEELAAKLRREESELADSWRSAVLDRAAVLVHEMPDPDALVVGIDRMVDQQPQVIEAPWEERSFSSRSDEPPYVAAQRILLRARRRFARMTGGSLPARQVELQKIAAYHFSGLTPERLESLAALLISAESHLADRTRSLFDGIIAGYDDLAERAPTAERATLDRRLKRLREQVEEEFQLANEELAAIVLDGAVRTATVLGRAFTDLKDDLPIANTPDLTTWQRRFSTVVGSRQRGRELLTDRFEAARRTNAAECAVVALELELVGLEGRIKQAVAVHGAQLGRTLQGRGPTQLDRVRSALDECIRTLDEVLDSKGTGAELAKRVRDATEPLAHVTGTAASNAQLLRDHLGDESALSPLLDELLRASAHLTERYRIPAGRAPRGEWKLPTTVGTTEVPFRQIAMAYIETAVTRRLVELSRGLSKEAAELTAMLEELERVIAFNTELATAEIEVVEDGQRSEARGLAREMLIGSLSRSQTRVDELREASRSWAERGRDGIREAVLDGLEDLRTEVVGGHATDLRLSLLRDAVSGRRLVDAERLGTNLGAARQAARSIVRSSLGEERLTTLRHTLGLPSSADDISVEPATFAAPEPRTYLPLVYKRLFSDQALEAGDLLTGRATEIDRARTALHDRAEGRLRSVVVVGMEGAGKGAVVTTLTRGFDPERVRRHHLTGPVDVATVQSWFDDKSDRLHVITGAGWLFALRPGGLAPLRALAAGVVADEGRNAWLLSASVDTWATAARATALDDAFPTVVQVKPFDPDALEAAILARHSMSGYALTFDAGEDLGWQFSPFRNRLDPEQAQRDAWFRALHRNSSGVMQDALLLWMASVLEVDESKAVIRMGPVPHLPVPALRGLSDDALVTLRFTLQQGWIDPLLYASAFRVGKPEAHAWLAHLRHLGLLQQEDEVLRVATHLRAVVHRVLSERGWV